MTTWRRRQYPYSPRQAPEAGNCSRDVPAQLVPEKPFAILYKRVVSAHPARAFQNVLNISLQERLPALPTPELAFMQHLRFVGNAYAHPDGRSSAMLAEVEAVLDIELGSRV